MQNRPQMIDIVFGYDGVEGEKIYDLISFLAEKYTPLEKFYLFDKCVSNEKLLKTIKSKKRWPTGVHSDSLEFRCGSVGSCNHSFFSIKEKKGGVIENWEPWVKFFFAVEDFHAGLDF